MKLMTAVVGMLGTHENLKVGYDVAVLKHPVAVLAPILTNPIISRPSILVTTTTAANRIEAR